MEREEKGFKSRLGFILAAAGSAVGLGNLWSFPSKTAGNGGAAFVFVYVIMALVIGVVAMIAEMYIGKRTGKNIIDSYRACGKRFTWIGALGVLSTTLIASYYIVLGGWVLKYTCDYLVGNLEHVTNFAGYFGEFVSNSGTPILFMAIFFAIAMLILIFGVQNGIEKVSKVLMPVLLILIVVLMIRSLTLDPAGVQKGLEFYLKPDFSKMKPSSVLAAMGQSFFSLSLGVGTMCVYGSYAKKHTGLAKSALTVVILDTTVALLAGFMIFPAIFASGLGEAEEVVSGGAGLFFIVMPQIFATMKGGRFFGFLFFFLVFVAAITSIISMVEVALQTTIEKTKIKRPAAVGIFTVAIFLVGCLVSLSMGAVPQLQVNGLSLLDFLDMIIQTYVMPIGTVMACVIVGWVLNKQELEQNFTSEKTRKVWLFLVKFITPILVTVIFVFGMFGQNEEGKWGLANWRVTLTAFVLIATFVITNQVVVTVKQKKGLYREMIPALEGTDGTAILVENDSHETDSDNTIIESDSDIAEETIDTQDNKADSDTAQEQLVEEDTKE